MQRRAAAGCLLFATLLGCVQPGSQHARPAPRVELAPRDADVWAFRIGVEGTVSGELAQCRVTVGESTVPVTPQAGGFRVELALAPGPNRVVASCRDSAGRSHASKPVEYTVRLEDVPTARVTARALQTGVELDASGSTQAEHSRAPLEHFTWWRKRGLGGARVELGSGPRITDTPSQDGEYFYEVQVTDARERSNKARAAVRVQAGRPSLKSEASSSWLEGAVVYGVIPPLFGAPPLAAVKRRMAYLADLGVSAVWLSPIFSAPEGDFGYAVTDYFAVRADYGTKDDLRELIEEAHRHEVRVLLDLVPNHTSDQHPYFRQAQEFGRESHYYPFYDRNAGGKVTHYFDWEHLPNLDYSHGEVRRWMREASVYWIREFGVDGYRVDAIWGVRQRAPGFFDSWKSQLLRVQPSLFLLAEASARDEFYLEHDFAAAYDWTGKLGEWAWSKVFESKSGIAQRFGAAIQATHRSTARPERVLRFLNNNDTGARFVTRHGIGLTRVASVALLTLPGIPCVYSFDEVGAEFEPYQQHSPISEAPYPELHQLHRKLIHLRRRHSALQGRGFLPVTASSPDVYAFVRESSTDRALALVVLNFSDRPIQAQLGLPDDIAERGSFEDALDAGPRIDASGGLSVQLAPFGFEVLVAQG